MFIIFCFNNGNWNVGFVIENVVNSFSCSTRSNISSDGNLTINKENLLYHLSIGIPSSILDGRGNKFGANISFGESFF